MKEIVNDNWKQLSIKRIVYFDYLRVAATFAVILIYIAAQNWYVVDIHSTDWKIFNFYDSAVRWAVPILVMISGSLFLGRKYEIRTIYSKHIFRLVTAFACWTSIYALFYGGDIKTIILRAIKGAEAHLWFIPMIIGLYICIPVLKKIVESDKITKYFLWVCFIFGFLLPWFVMVINHFGGGLLKEIVSAMNVNFINMEFSFVKGYPFYFILGYWLFRTNLHKKIRYIVYGLGIIGVTSTFLLTLLVSFRMGIQVEDYYNYLSMNVLFESVAVFIWFQYHCHGIKILNGVINRMAEYSFGAYLVHFLVIHWLEMGGITTSSFHQALSVPIISGVVFVISYLISAVLNHIPYIKKYVV